MDLPFHLHRLHVVTWTQHACTCVAWLYNIVPSASHSSFISFTTTFQPYFHRCISLGLLLGCQCCSMHCFIWPIKETLHTTLYFHLWGGGVEFPQQQGASIWRTKAIFSKQHPNGWIGGKTAHFSCFLINRWETFIFGFSEVLWGRAKRLDSELGILLKVVNISSRRITTSVQWRLSDTATWLFYGI